ncbi:Ppx/GppA family phosphatase, partial [candidate division KSB1 bacterium]|nr:Ppx/GppA family phosphatase [candidate division KSB1 bacterium]
MEKFAVIDIGTNSIKMTIATKRSPDDFEILEDHIEITRLGEKISATGILRDAPISRTIDALKKMKQRIDDHDVKQIAVVSTKVLRLAENRDQFIDHVKSECGFTVEVISGEKEAQLSFLATRFIPNVPQE